MRYFLPRTVAQLCKPRNMVLPALSVAALSLAFIPRSQVASALSVRTSELPMSFTISSPGFTNGGDIPKKFTCDDADRSPQLTWTEPPRGTKTFAILVDDPDAPVGNWNHWAIWNLPASLRELAEGIGKDAHLPDGSQQGMNDFHKIGYNGPCPPAGKPHRYHFKIFALDAKLNLDLKAGKPELERAIKGHVLAQAEWMGKYKR